MQRYESTVDDKFIYHQKDLNDVHCCTCHNNPRRYVEGVEPCSFCQEYKKYKKDRKSIDSGFSQFSFDGETFHVKNNPEESR